jgi:probable H4MPT-linked C1 transfer pathway protein
LKSGELVYTGVLRTPLPAVCSKLPVEGEEVGLASESFAVMGDVYRVLGMLDADGYTCETPDNRGKDVGGCMQRIARAFCSDLKEIGEELVLEAAAVFHREQVNTVARALREVAGSHNLTKVVGCGLGRRMLAERAAEVAGLREFIDLAGTYGEEAALNTPAFSVGVLAEEVASGGSRY